MAEIQLQEFENVMAEYYIGNEIPKYFGHYFIPASFHCEECRAPKKKLYVCVWLEIKARKLIAVRTRDPEMDEPAKQILAR